MILHALDRILCFLQQAAWEALSRVVASVPKEVQPSYIKVVRDAISTSRDKERRKKKVNDSVWGTNVDYRSFDIILTALTTDVFLWMPTNLNTTYCFNLQGGPILIPGFCLPKALQPLLPIFLQVFVLYTFSPSSLPKHCVCLI